ncbi:MAG: hypothetical protein JWO82_1953, partial [Akkermansiaceae bacterium]|nr:hypothetical protein [Akkermansiaceae bacterium]
MQSSRFTLLACLVLAACGPATMTAPAAEVGSSLSGGEKTAIGKKIWQNESAGKVDGLTAWNGGEEFPSLGIGHFIWYPAGFQGPFEESWPKFIAYARQHGAQPPAIALSKSSPWKSQA